MRDSTGSSSIGAFLTIKNVFGSSDPPTHAISELDSFHWSCRFALQSTPRLQGMTGGVARPDVKSSGNPGKWKLSRSQRRDVGEMSSGLRMDVKRGRCAEARAARQPTARTYPPGFMVVGGCQFMQFHNQLLGNAGADLDAWTLFAHSAECAFRASREVASNAQRRCRGEWRYHLQPRWT